MQNWIIQTVTVLNSVIKLTTTFDMSLVIIFNFYNLI